MLYIMTSIYNNPYQDLIDPTIPYAKTSSKKPLSKKQKKSRAKSKAAKKARKR